jgi:hypothetical protein
MGKPKSYGRVSRTEKRERQNRSQEKREQRQQRQRERRERKNQPERERQGGLSCEVGYLLVGIVLQAERDAAAGDIAAQRFISLLQECYDVAARSVSI